MLKEIAAWTLIGACISLAFVMSIGLIALGAIR